MVLSLGPALAGVEADGTWLGWLSFRWIMVMMTYDDNDKLANMMIVGRILVMIRTI